MNSLQTIENELRILDVTLAEELGYVRPTKIRELIQRHRESLEKLGVLPTVGKTSSEVGGRPTDEFYLNKAQAVFITTQSGTPTAIEATVRIVKKFDDYENGSTNLPAEVMNDPIIKMRLEQIEMDKRITKLESMLPAPTTHMTILGYASAQGIIIDMKRANALGRRAAALTNMRGLVIAPVPDDRYGTVNSYPLAVLGEVFK